MFNLDIIYIRVGESPLAIIVLVFKEDCLEVNGCKV